MFKLKYKSVITIIFTILLLVIFIGIYIIDGNFNAKSVAVLCYHDVDIQENAKFYYPCDFTNIENFEKQMNFLYKHHYKTLKLDDFYGFVNGKRNLPKKSILITFDDNRKNIYQNAYPILKKYGFRAVVFVITDTVGKEGRLSKAELKEMKDVFEYASHTNNMHTLINKKSELLLKSEDEIKSDISKSLESTMPYFAYPFGQYNKKLISILKKQGIKAAFTVKNGHVNIGDSLYLLKRNLINESVSFQDFCKILESPSD